MQQTINIGYDQVFQLVRQLSSGDRKRLVKEITFTEEEPSEPDTLYDSDYVPRTDLIPIERDGHIFYQVPFPDTEEGRQRQIKQEQLQKEFREEYPELFVTPSKEEIEKNREEALRLAMECPVATPEEIEYYKEFRRLFRCRTM
jgi:hypothetical protein